MKATSAQERGAGHELQAMLDELRARCPVIRPSVMPATLSDGEQGVALLGLCCDDAERHSLASRLASARRGLRQCALTSRAVEDANELRFVSLWELRPSACSCELQRCTFACADAALLLDTAAMLERFTKRGADSKELLRLAEVFCEANCLPGQQARLGLSARLWLQECLALAYACQVVAGNVASWQLRGPDGELIGLGGQQTALGVAERMLETTPTQPTKGGRKGKRLRG